MKSQDFVHEITQTSAIFGRQKDVAVEFQGDQAMTDGKTIILPSMPHDMDFSNEEVLAIRGYLDHEAGHIRHTDFTLVKPFGDAHGTEAHAIANCLEDIRLEAAVMREYPGSEKNFRGIFDSIKDKEEKFIKENSELYGEEATINNVCAAITTMGRDGYLSQSYKDAIKPTLHPKWQAWGEKWREEVLQCKDTKEVMNMALRIKELLDQTTSMGSDQPEEGEGDPDKGDKGDKGLDGDPKDFTFDKDGDPLAGGKPKGEEEKEQESKMKEAPSQNPTSYCDEMIKDKMDQHLKYSPTNTSTKYRVFTTKFDEVFSINSVNKRTDERVATMRKATTAAYEKYKGQIGGQVNTMKARLRRALMSKETRDWDFGREFGKLDTKRLVAGFQGSGGVFKQRKDRVEANTSVMLLVDLSGSMSGDKVITARDSVIAFAECLEGTQIKYEINGFDNGSRYLLKGSTLGEGIRKAEEGKTKFHRVEPLNIFQYKKFNDPLRVSKGAISAIGDMANGNNSDTDAVLWCLQRLSEQPTERKVLIVLSDGSPYNYTINVDYNDLVKPLTDTVKSAMKEYGVECVGIGIQDDTVKQIYPKNVVIQNVQELSGSIFAQLSELLTGGKARL